MGGDETTESVGSNTPRTTGNSLSIVFILKEIPKEDKTVNLMLLLMERCVRSIEEALLDEC